MLFPFIDGEPEDGYISLRELEAWNVKQAKDRLFYRTQKDMDYYDKDGDGEISFREYLPQFSEEQIGNCNSDLTSPSNIHYTLQLLFFYFQAKVVDFIVSSRSGLVVVAGAKQTGTCLLNF